MREIFGTIFTIVFDILAVVLSIQVVRDVPPVVAWIIVCLFAAVGLFFTFKVGKYWLYKLFKS